MPTTQTKTKEPPSVSLEVVSWLLSAKLWLWTLALTGIVAALVGAIGWLQHDVPPGATAVESLTTPRSALAVFLGARGVAFLNWQRRRDRSMAAGRTALNSDVSIASVITVASYTIIGLIATGVAMPILYRVSGSYFYLAAGIAVVATPPGFLLLIHQLHELIAADRYRRGFRVLPGAWFYAASLPWVVVAWMLLTGQTTVTIPVPPEARAATTLLWASELHVDAWGVAFAGVCAPTALAYVYTVRRQAEAFVRRVFGL